jgi:hypothetical protein
MRVNVIKIGSPNTIVEVNDGATFADCVNSLPAEYQGNYLRYLNDVQVTTDGQPGTYAPTQQLAEGDVIAFTMKVKGG